MPITFSIFLTQLATALQGENGPDLAYLLRPTSPHGKDLLKELRSPTVFIYFIALGTAANIVVSRVNNFHIMKEVLKGHGMRSLFNMSS
jgi:hypothetical protein